MSKATLIVIYTATILTLFAPTIERVRTIIVPGIEQLTVTLQEVTR